MSEHEHEQDGNPDAEPDEAIQPDDEDDDAADAEQSPAQAAQQEGSAEVARKLDLENSRHFRAVSKILDQDMEPHTCPTCNGFGFADAPADDGPELAHDETKDECPVCKGYGQLRTPSRDPGHALTMCVNCSGQGFVVKSAAEPERYAPVTQLPTAQAAQAGTLLPDGRFLPFGSTEPITIYNPATG